MSFKSIFFSCSLVLASAASFAGGEIMPADNFPAPVMEACTLSASFTSGDVTIDVTVTAETCGGAAATLGVIADAIDGQE